MNRYELIHKRILINQKEYRLWMILLIFGIIFFVLNIFTVQFGVDDSFITFRYAQNLVQHGVWNWNATGDKVEAYTNFIYAVVAIIPEGLGISSFIFFKVFGCLTLLYLSIRLYQLLGNSLAFLLSLSFLICNPLFYLHAYSGLETPLFVLLIFELTICLSRYKEIWPEKRLLLIMLLLPLTRPEGALYSIVGFIFLVYKKERVENKLVLISVCVVASSYFILRYIYFGQLLPNTFYVKSDIPFEPIRVITYILNSFIFWSAPLLWFFVKATGFRLMLICSILVNILYSYSDLQMNFAYRFPFQSLAPLYLSAIVLAYNPRRTQDFFKLAIVIIFFIGEIWGSLQLFRLAGDYPRLRQAHGSLGVALSKYRDENLTIMAGDVGLIPYYSGWNTFDYIGLANERVARNGMTLELAKEIKPDLVLLYSSNNFKQQTGFDFVRNQTAVKKYLEENTEYDFIGAVKLDDGFYLLAYLKNTLKQFNNIKESIQDVDNLSRNFKVDKNKFFQLYYLRKPD